MNASTACATSDLVSVKRATDPYREGIQNMDTGFCERGLRRGLSRMKGNFQVRFLGEEVAAMPLPYPPKKLGISTATRALLHQQLPENTVPIGLLDPKCPQT